MSKDVYIVRMIHKAAEIEQSETGFSVNRRRPYEASRMVPSLLKAYEH